MCLSTPQQGTNVARPRPVLRVRSSFTRLGFGCARLAPPHPKGVKLEGRRTNYRNRFTPASSGIRQRRQATEIKTSLVLAQRLGSDIRQRRQATEIKIYLVLGQRHSSRIGDGIEFA